MFDPVFGLKFWEVENAVSSCISTCFENSYDGFGSFVEFDPTTDEIAANWRACKVLTPLIFLAVRTQLASTASEP